MSQKTNQIAGKITARQIPMRGVMKIKSKITESVSLKKYKKIIFDQP